MVKQKINTSDIYVLIKEFKEILLNSRVNNIYDIDNRCFLLKLTSDSKEKYFVLLDSNPQAPRFQITQQNFERRTIPSSFCTKLRKHITNKKLTRIEQLGSDRVVCFQFGYENKFNIIMELYDSGNILLTDNDYNIMTLVRRYTLSEAESEDLVIKVGNKYPTDQEVLDISKIKVDELKEIIKISFENTNKNSLRNIFISNTSPLVNLGKDIIYHSIHCLDYNPNKKISLELAQNFPIDKFLKIITETLDLLNQGKGYIIYSDKEKQVQEEFVPILYKHLSNKFYTEFSTMSSALDTFFQLKNSIENKESQKNKKSENSKKDNLDKIERLEESIKTRILDF